MFYKNFHRLPESEDKNYREQIKRRRFEIVANKFKMDLRPRVFMRVMSKELLLLSFGIFFGLSKLSIKERRPSVLLQIRKSDLQTAY